MATRKWLDTSGGGGPFPGAAPLPAMTNEQLTDRYSSHTRDCPSCSAVCPLSSFWDGRISSTWVFRLIHKFFCFRCPFFSYHPQEFITDGLSNDVTALLLLALCILLPFSLDLCPSIFCHELEYVVQNVGGDDMPCCITGGSSISAACADGI